MVQEPHHLEAWRLNMQIDFYPDETIGWTAPINKLNFTELQYLVTDILVAVFKRHGEVIKTKTGWENVTGQQRIFV